MTWKEGEIYSTIFMDVAAFNNVHHNRFIYNLKRTISEQITRWMESFLSERSTRLRFRSPITDPISIPAVTS